MRQKKVYYDAAIRFSLATLPGAVIGSYLARYFTSHIFYISFGLLLISIAGLLYWLLREEDETVCRADVFPAQYNRLWGRSLSVMVGFLSSTFGIGGGIIHVPAMIFARFFYPCCHSHVTLCVSAFHFFWRGFSLFFGQYPDWPSTYRWQWRSYRSANWRLRCAKNESKVDYATALSGVAFFGLTDDIKQY